MTIGMNLGKKAAAISLAIVGLAAASFLPTHAQADSTVMGVCNTASHAFQNGTYVVLEDGSVVRFNKGLRAMNGDNAGLTNAAAHSRALAECGVVNDTSSESVDPGSSWGGLSGDNG